MHSLKYLCNDLLKNNTGLGAKKWSICASLKTQLCENCSTQLDVNTVFWPMLKQDRVQDWHYVLHLVIKADHFNVDVKIK